MSSLTVARFNQLIETMLTRMGVNLARDGHLSHVILGLTLTGETVSILAGPPGTPTSTEPGPDRIPIYVVAGPFSQTPGPVEQIFLRHRVIAAIVIGEAWGLTGEDARRAMETGARAKDSPNRTELATLTGYAPTLNFLRTVAVPMVRASKKAGSAFQKTSPTFIGRAANYEGGPDRVGSVTLNWDAVNDATVDLGEHGADRVHTWLMDVLR